MNFNYSRCIAKNLIKIICQDVIKTKTNKKISKQNYNRTNTFFSQ